MSGWNGADAVRGEGRCHTGALRVPGGPSGEDRPVLYLDIDDTLLRYPNGRDDPSPAEGASEFLHWALDHFEVRWLTRWCPGGRMKEEHVRSLSKMLDTDAEIIRRLRGLDWTCSETKLDGIAWLEHVLLGRRFLWIEDEYGLRDQERAFLRSHGFDHAWRHCNVTSDPESLRSLHRSLRNGSHQNGSR